MARSRVAAHQKKARREGRRIAFIDESGFMLQPVRRRTWAPEGRTPIERSSARHDRISAIGGLTMSPHRRRVRLYFRLHHHNIRHGDVIDFLRLMKRAGKSPMLVVLDRLNAHRSAVPQLKARYGDAMIFEWLPPYAPDLNPVEPVWNHTKYGDMANFVPDDVMELRRRLDWSLRCRRTRPSDLRSCFDYAELQL